MQITQTLPLLGGLSPQQFMKRHWQKKPLLVRGAVPGLQPLLVAQRAVRPGGARRGRVAPGRPTRGRAGPFAGGRSSGASLPPLSRPGWTLLVQGVDLHDDRAHELLSRFCFVPHARVDDLMIS